MIKLARIHLSNRHTEYVVTSVLEAIGDLANVAGYIHYIRKDDYTTSRSIIYTKSLL